MHVTIFKHGLNTHKGSFLIWTSDPSMRSFYWHVFKGVTTTRFYFTFHFLGFVASGSVPRLGGAQ